jgi:serine/threonine-protein kinase RsbW
MAESPNVTLRLASKPENVLLVRQTLSGLADAIGLDPIDLNDVNTAVTEACNNVVLHAYGRREGPLEMDVCVAGPVLEIVVRDHGRGIAPRAQPSEPVDGGIGLPVISALTRDVELRDLAGNGTEVRMRFELSGTAAIGSAGANGGAAGLDDADGWTSDTAYITVAPTLLARTVLPRVLCSLAARAHFSTDRISDTRLLAEALLAHLDGAVIGDRLDFGISVAPRELQLRLGPLRAGRGDALIRACAVDSLGPVIERLAEHHAVAATGEAGEQLALRLLQRA